MTRKKAEPGKKAEATVGIAATIVASSATCTGVAMLAGRAERQTTHLVVREYLDTARLPARVAADALRLERTPDENLDLTRLAPPDREALERVTDRTMRFTWWVAAQATGEKKGGRRLSTLPKDSPGRWVPRSELAGIIAAMPPREAPGPAAPGAEELAVREDIATAILEQHSATCAGWIAEYETLSARARLTPEETAARVVEVLTRKDGSIAPSPLAWCNERGYPVVAFARWLAQEEVHDAEQRATDAEKAAKKAAKDLKAGLADRIVFPQQTINATHQPGRTRGLLARAAQGEIFADEATKALAREGMEVHPATLPKLVGLEKWVMAGVFRCFTSGEEGSAFRDRVEVPFATLLAASGMDKANQANRRAFFLAMGTLSRKLWRMAVMIPNKKNGSAVYGAEEPLFRFRPAWTQSGDGRRGYATEEAADIARSWTAGGGASWNGPLPDQVVLTLPDIVRYLARRLVIPVGTFEALDRGSKAVRGAKKGSTDLDFALFIEITQRQQPLHGGLAFVDRDELLARHYGGDAVKRQRDQGKYKGGYLAAYETSVRALEAGEVARRVQSGTPLKRGGGVRDHFELAEGAILNPSPGRDTETLALPLADAGTK